MSRDGPDARLSGRFIKYALRGKESFHIDQIASLLQSTDAFNSVGQLVGEVARCCLYHFFQPGTIICSEDEVRLYFCVVHGSVSVASRNLNE